MLSIAKLFLEGLLGVCPCDVILWLSVMRWRALWVLRGTSCPKSLIKAQYWLMVYRFMKFIFN